MTPEGIAVEVQLQERQLAEGIVILIIVMRADHQQVAVRGLQDTPELHDVAGDIEIFCPCDRAVALEAGHQPGAVVVIAHGHLTAVGHREGIAQESAFGGEVLDVEGFTEPAGIGVWSRQTVLEQPVGRTTGGSEALRGVGRVTSGVKAGCAAQVKGVWLMVAALT